MFLCHALPIVDRIFFRCFGMSCFVSLVLPFVDIFLIFLLSPVLYGSIVILSYVVFSFLFLHIPASFLCFIILASFRRFFLFALPLEFPILVLIFPSGFLSGSQFSHKLISLLHRLVYLIRLYYSLIYKVVLDLFCSFPS